MNRIAHISDSHISYDDENGHGKRLVELLTDIKERNCSHIIVTGDLVENPDMRDLQLVREIFAKFGLLDFSKMSVIPGNHDIFGGAPNGKMFFKFPLICKEVNYEENADKFIDTFKETFPNNNSFPYVKIIENIAFIGINSVDRWSEDKNTEGSNGRIPKKDLKKIKKILSASDLMEKYKIVLIHHHFYAPVFIDEYPAHSLWLKIVNWKMRLYKINKILNLFKKHKVNLVLHGHTHINQIYSLKGISFINSSASCVPITDDQIRKYNIISIPGESDADKNITVETIIL